MVRGKSGDGGRDLPFGADVPLRKRTAWGCGQPHGAAQQVGLSSRSRSARGDPLGVGQPRCDPDAPPPIRACLLYAGAMDTSWGVWSTEDRRNGAGATVPADALAPGQVACLITWLAAVPADVVFKEVTGTPLLEQAWP